jgi:hypothetical protein
MDAVAIELAGEIGPVVHDEGDSARLRDRLQDAGCRPDRRIVAVFEAQLQAGDVAAGERLFELAGEAVGFKRGRRYQIEPRRRPLVIPVRDQSCP